MVPERLNTSRVLHIRSCNVRVTSTAPYVFIFT